MAKEKKLDKKDKKSHLRHFFKITGYCFLSVFIYFWTIGVLRSFIQYIQSDCAIMGIPGPFFTFICSFTISAIFIAIFETKFSKHYFYCHELTHAFFGILSGSRVSKLKIREDGASVNVSHPNIIVILAPYIVSIHVLLALFIYGCFVTAFPNSNEYIHSFFTILVGLASAFHFVFTIKSLLQKQSDIERVGFFLSFLMITSLNLVGTMVIITCIDTISLSYFIKSSLMYGYDTIIYLWFFFFSL